MDKKIPITRLNKFFSDEDFALDLQIGSEYLEGDLNFKLVLYRIDRMGSQVDNVYGEAQSDELKFLPPVEFTALVEIGSPDLKAYKNGMMTHLEPGNLKVSVYTHHLVELGIDINKGDYIGYLESEDRIRYYSVSNDGKVISDNRHTIGGFKSFYRTIIASPVQDSEFRGL